MKTRIGRPHFIKMLITLNERTGFRGRGLLSSLANPSVTRRRCARPSACTFRQAGACHRLPGCSRAPSLLPTQSCMNFRDPQDEENGEVTHCLTIVAISSDMTRLGNQADLCDKLAIRHRHAAPNLEGTRRPYNSRRNHAFLRNPRMYKGYRGSAESRG